MNDRRRELIQELQEHKEYRSTYAQQHVNSVLATQIATIRQQRGMTQQDLAALIGKHQPAISRNENVNYARWNIASLRQLADAYDCWLNVRFEPWGNLVRDVESISGDRLRVERIEDDPLFFGSESTTYIPEPVLWMQKQVLPWLSSHGDPNKLAAWLQGEDLPPVGDEDPYFLWIARAVDAEPADSVYRPLLVEQVLNLWQQIKQGAKGMGKAGRLLVGVFQLLARFPSQEGWLALSSIYNPMQRPAMVDQGAVEAAYWNALTWNQLDAALYPDWLSIIHRRHHWSSCDEFDALEGLKHMKPAPRFKLIARALNHLYQAQPAGKSRADLNDYFVDVFENLKVTFEGIPNFSGALRDEAVELQWSEELFTSWSEVFDTTVDSATGMLESGSRKIISEEAAIRGALVQA